MKNLRETCSHTKVRDGEGVSGESRTHIEMLRTMYPGHCGYMSETGAIMKNLRESCSHTKVREGGGSRGRATHTLRC